MKFFEIPTTSQIHYSAIYVILLTYAEYTQLQKYSLLTLLLLLRIRCSRIKHDGSRRDKPDGRSSHLSVVHGNQLSIMVVECNNSWVPYKQVNDLVDSYYHKYVIVHKHVGQCNIDNSL